MCMHLIGLCMSFVSFLYNTQRNLTVAKAGFEPGVKSKEVEEKRPEDDVNRLIIINVEV